MKTTAQLAKCLANIDVTDLSSNQAREKVATVICDFDLDLDDAKPTIRLVLGRVMRSLERK